MPTPALESLGWKPFFEQQLSLLESAEMTIARVAAHFGSKVTCLTDNGELAIPATLLTSCEDLAVGDWLLLHADTQRGERRLERQSLVSRKAVGEQRQTQAIAANIDTLFIVSSCNDDFNEARLERYLALASESNVMPVVLLTKADLCDDSTAYKRSAEQLQPGLVVESVNALDPHDLGCIEHWCKLGQTVGLVGSSGVGKSTLAMSLGGGEIATAGIREDDAKGRHTTTARQIHRMNFGGLIIDTPGMRELQLADCEAGLSAVFEEITVLATECHFSDCSHQGEPGCAVQASIEKGQLEPRRLKNYLKLQAEQARNAQSIHERRNESRKQGRYYKSVMKSKKKRREGDG